MGRSNISAGFIMPFKSDGTREQEDATEFGRGAVTLASGQTYFFPLGGDGASVISCHLQHDAGIIITSATLEDCNFPLQERDSTTGVIAGAGDTFWYTASATGAWIDEDPSTAFVGTVGANTSATNGVVAATGGVAGGAMFHLTDTGARHTRLKVVVGGTGGEVRVHAWGKD